MTIALNAALGLGLVAVLLLLLGHYGVNKDKSHRRRLFRHHQLRRRTTGAR